MKYIFTCIAFASILGLSAQTVSIFGTITESGNNLPIEFAQVFILETNKGVETNAAGEYAISIPANKKTTIQFRRVGYKIGEKVLEPMPAGTQRRLDVSLASSTSQKEVVIKDNRIKDVGMVHEDLKDFKLLPTTTGNLESVLPYIALGTNSGTGGELSSQYQVRGGNYDENLVYVNDFEIFRPQLVRQGQQEGLTFANPDLIRDLSFSSGGFESRYGDKLASVLDIKYKRPDSFKSSIAASFLGGSAHLEGSKNIGSDGYRKLRYLIGARYKTTKYLLGALDVKGEYAPSFGDVQAYITYDINRDWQIGLLGNYNTSIYNFVPLSSSVAAGLVNFAFQANTAFQGQERDEFTNGMGGVSLTYLPDRKKNPFFLKFLASRYQNLETEGVDIIGDYILGQKETNLGSDNAGTLVNQFGSGTQHQFIRDNLYSTVTNFEHKGGIELQKDRLNAQTSVTHFLQWGVKAQKEEISDKINEWERLDSALYSLPYDTSKLLLSTVLKTQNQLSSLRFSGYLQDTYTWRKDSVGELQLTVGARGAYWDLNKEAFISPRAQLAYKPLSWKPDMSFRLSGGLYYQSPFYKELRDPQGIVHTDVRSQKSAQIVGGWTYNFFSNTARRIPFKLIVEAYYKKLWDLVSYNVDNVRVIYSGKNDATGYAAGLDMRINGEFVPGAESWINLSFLSTREKLDGIQHLQRNRGDSIGVAVADVPRPTDQLFTLNVFFQDYLPKNKNFKVHMNALLGSGLPFGIPNNNIVYRNTYRYQPYQRVDLGFSYLMWDRAWLSRKPHHPLRFTKTTWASLEVFNLMDISNEASKTWLKTIYNTQYAIPNYLTGRRVNLRVRMEF